MPEIPELHAALGDEVVELRGIAEWDIPEILIAHEDDPMLHVALGQRSAPSGAELGREVELAEQRRRDGEYVELTILSPGDGYCRGRVIVSDLDWDRRTARLCIWVAPAWRRRGFARHALALVSRWLLESVGLTRLELLAPADNEPVLRAARAAGFEGDAPVQRDQPAGLAGGAERDRVMILLALERPPGD